MPDNHYPSVDMDFIIEHVKASGKIVEGGVVKFGSTTTFVVTGQQAIYKRSTLIRELEPGKVCLEQATALALKFSFLGQLIEWLIANKNWKEGAYIVPQNQNSAN
jgi:hypothetical protein